MLGKERVSRVYEHADGSRTSLSIRHLSAALILFGASHTFWRYPLRALFATRPKHPKPARTPASTPDPHHARSTTNPSNSLFYLVKLGTEGFCSHSRFCIKMSVLVERVVAPRVPTLLRSYQKCESKLSHSRSSLRDNFTGNDTKFGSYRLE